MKCSNCGHVNSPAPRRTGPKGGKHANCLVHVQHPYPSNGFLCIGEPTVTPEDRISWADEIAWSAEAHRAAEYERMGLPTEAWRRSWHVLTAEMVKLANGECYSVEKLVMETA